MARGFPTRLTPFSACPRLLLRNQGVEAEMDQSSSSETRGEPTMSDAEFFAARRETMGEDYPGDEAMRAFDREADAEWRAQVEQDRAETASPAPAAQAPAEASAPAQPAEWNAGDWLRETFKDDPAFKDLSAGDMARLEALANQKHDEFTGEIRDWAQEKGEAWSSTLKDGIRDGLDSHPELRDFFETRLADGDMSADDKAVLEGIAKDLTPAEGAAVVRPVVEALHEVEGELYDGVEMIAGHAIEDVREIVEARAEMPGGDGAQVQTMLHQLEEAPEQIHDALDWQREQADIQFEKVDDRLELIEAGTDPRDLPVDTDTYQIDDHADQYDMADA